MKRVFLIVLDSLGIGQMPDSASFGDMGVNTLASCAKSSHLHIPNLIRAGLGNIDGVTCPPKTDAPMGAVGRLAERSQGKDTTIGHWEIGGIVSGSPLPTYPEGFPEEIAAIKAACKGKLLKVIIETCLLTQEEKIALCKSVTDAKADYIKTSTGFSTAGATFEDVALFAQHIGPDVKIKAAGGISSLDDAEKFIALGASRLGTSRIVKIAKGLQNDGAY